MKKRVITAVVALMIFIPLLILGGIWLDITAFVLGMIALSEILIMKKQILVSIEAIISLIGTLFVIAPVGWYQNVPTLIRNPFFALYIFIVLLLLSTVFTDNRFSFDDAGVISLGMMYIGMGFHYFLAARAENWTIIMYALLIVWCTDSGAYIFGKKFGKHKLSPVSPNKTWEGSIGGTVLAVIVCTIWLMFFPNHIYNNLIMFFITILLSITGQFGDLIESAIKRYYGVKDSGKILPGHGGILDRFDSLLLVLPVLHLVGII
ncbi:phosphatidate cytidylyltransferase [Philodulcilactobacillus myokoensis]|uniref:Phosphatidate cytidylyltransferase n=1 Tax=Philodulcilactobacillus myokoensis TaxID=2929573 RepID=A0A9W6B1T9_9LACO|nr:phosphatidate cytidylyltransferase [Philodulcilactobacillus myokoensis]GLB46950.1 phosphatidate cytidylyltransferase [Philodulcilactobacillus myokoensis]